MFIGKCLQISILDQNHDFILIKIVSAMKITLVSILSMRTSVQACKAEEICFETSSLQKNLLNFHKKFLISNYIPHPSPIGPKLLVNLQFYEGILD